MESLTDKQRKVLDFIEDRLRRGQPPSQREIAGHFKLSQNAAHQFVSYLRKKGYLVSAGGHRGLRLSPRYQQQHTRPNGVPLVGSVAAGEPILAQENIERYLDCGTMFGDDPDIFLLKVVGDSMIDDGIMEDDYVVVKPRVEVENGQIAVVLIEDEATVKRVSFQRDHIALKPANRRAGYKTRIIRRNEKNVSIIGKVVGCLRTIDYTPCV